MQRLVGKLALVTGGGAGLGAAIARRFAEEGAEVIVNDVDGEAAEAVAKEVGGTAVVADVSDSKAVRRMFESIRERHGRLDVLVNNAGIGIEDEETQRRFNEVPIKQVEEFTSRGAIETHWDFTVNLSDEQWHRMIAVHLDGTFFCTREALTIMGPRMSGVIINLGSIMGTTGGAGASRKVAPRSRARQPPGHWFQISETGEER